MSSTMIVHMRRLILGISTEFPNSPSWRFVDAIYEFPNPANPWQEEFPEAIYYNTSSPGELHLNFIAVKIGDVNGNASTE